MGFQQWRARFPPPGPGCCVEGRSEQSKPGYRVHGWKTAAGENLTWVRLQEWQWVRKEVASLEKPSGGIIFKRHLLIPNLSHIFIFIVSVSQQCFISPGEEGLVFYVAEFPMSITMFGMK